MSGARFEEALTFGCHGEQLVGILHPAHGAADTGVLVVVGGPQYRAGSHRQFVHLGRALAGAGYPVLRFDYRGMGDSEGAVRNFEHVSDDIEAAVNALQQRLPPVKHVVLWGLCDGASAALMYCEDKRDARVSGLCVLNPWVRSQTSLASTQLKHYYTRRVLEPQFWAKLLSGGVALGALRELGHKIGVTVRASGPAKGQAGETAGFQQRMALGWHRASARILLILSGDDYTAKEFIEHTGADKTWRALLAQPGLRCHTVADADHTFSDAASRLAAERVTIDWLKAQRFATGA